MVSSRTSGASPLGKNWSANSIPSGVSTAAETIRMGTCGLMVFISRANPIQQTVPSSVSQNVIHQPKTVQVDVEQCCPPAGPAALLQRRAQHSLVISAVVQPGEGVVLGLERQFLHQVALL